MKKLILALMTLLISVGASTTVYAGSINSNEQEVLNAAGQTYEYNGTKYQLAEAYISQLRDYMMADDIDLTVEQKNKALASVNSYIEQGVQGGYLVPLGGQSDTGSGNNSTDTGNTGSNASDTSGTAGSTGEDASTGSDKNSDVTKDITDKSSSDSGSIDDSKKKDRAADLDKDLEKIFAGDSEAGNTPSGEVTEDSKSSIREEDSSTAEDTDTAEEQEDTVIKDTGYDLGPTLAVAAFMGVIMLAGIIVTVRYHFFAQSDE